jgi:ElaB/YqjD/DUF883 family membrane-anchored ribosome-binding protein
LPEIAMTEPVWAALLDDVKTLVAQAEAVLEETAGSAASSADGVRERAAHTLSQARTRLQALEAAAERSVREAATRTDRAVHDHPWAAVGIGAAVGVVIGLLLGRRDK